MISVKRSIRSEEVLHDGQHVLFVEGTDSDSVDPTVLNELFDNGLRIRPLGPSFSVKSVAKALSHHPSYYFLIDRDHQDDAFIEECWTNFPNPDTHNLLVWKRREIENYFLEPDYLVRSTYCKVSKEKLESKVLQFSQERLFLDAANHVIIVIREELKQNWIHKFSCSDDFPNKESALEMLKKAPDFGAHASNVTRQVSVDELEIRFNECLYSMTGGQNQISFGTGLWLEMIQGKKVLSHVINSECFCVKATDGKLLSGKEKLNAVIKDLLKKDEILLPDDFRKLKKLISKRLNGN
ncbi:hypothetical protein P0082_09930 [Candidatus Haliotispira prima]|uniref:DUF4435 domain-containing protein n=1 Tax=Candidatus Haliotispira prima TaxID=3034016 RepID=A0ABY8MFV3_9SPIO|nr:hypothetical protein P0082_09930 [Candidatus Haliotispira prima]